MDEGERNNSDRYPLQFVAHNQKRAAEVAGVSTKTMQRWRKKGLIAPRVVDGVELYLHADLERLLKGAQ